MPLNANPHFYDSFGGFDTSTLYNNDAFAASALTSGTGGKAIADAVAAINAPDHAAATNSAIALINKVASDNGVSPITSLVTFIHQLVALNHDTSLVQYVQTAFVALIAANTVTATNTATQATAAAIAIAQSGDTANAVAAGGELSIILSQVHISGGGTSPYPLAIDQIEAAVGSSLTVNQAIDMLAGMPLGYSGPSGDSQSALQALVGSDAAKATRAITAFATGFATNSHDEAWTYIGQVATWVGFSTTQTNAVVAGLIGSTLTAAQAVVLLSQLPGGAQDIAALISNGDITASNAFAALATYAASAPGTPESSAAASALIAIAAVTPVDFAVQMAAASAFAGLIGVTMDANSAINMIANHAQLMPEASLSMLAAIGALGNVLSQSNNKYSLQLIGDAIRVDMNNGLSATAAVAALAAGFASLGLSVDQQVTILAGTGGIGSFNSGFQFVGEPALKAAAAAQIYSLIQANGLTAQQLAADFAGAMSNQNIFWPQIVDVLIRVAGSDTAVSGLVGAALTNLIGLSPFAGASAISTVITAIHADSVFPTQVITAAQTTGILIGMAGTGAVAVQVAAGAELGSLMQGAGFGATSAAAITAALTASTLTTSQATLFLAGAAGNSNSILIKGVSQNAYTDLLASLVSSDYGANSIAAVHGAVVASALTADKALFFLTALGANSTGATQTAAANEILALATGGLVDAAHAAGVLAGAAGTVGTVTALFLPGFTVGSQGYNDLLSYQNTFQETIGAQIALLTTTPAAGLSAQAAVDAIDAAVVTTHKLTAADAIRVLMSAAASDAAIEPLAQAEIINLIGGNVITSAAAVAVLQGMLAGASAALQTVINNELGILLADFSTLDATAGTGNSAQILAAAIGIDSLLNGSPGDQANGQTVLDHLGGRITGATLPSAGAIELLLDLAGRSPNGLSTAVAALQTLSTPIGQGFGIIRYDTVISTTGTMLAAGKLSSSAALAVLGSFSIYNNSTFPFTQTALAAAIGTGATHITIAQIDAAVQAGSFPVADALGALGKFAKDNGGSLQTQAIAEINALATDQTTRGLAVQALVDIVYSTDPTIRSAGYTGLNSFLTANPSFAVQAFALVAPRANSGDAVANSDAMAELVILASTFGVGAGNPLASDITTPIANLITASIAQQGGNIVGEAPWLQVLVNLLDVLGVEQGIINFLLQRSNTDLLNGEAFTVNTIIRDIAVTYGDNTGRLNTTVNELYQFLFYISPADMVAALAGASGAEQTNILTGLLGLYNQQGSSPAQQAAIDAFSLRLTQLHPTASTIGPLYQNGSLTAEQAMALLAPIIQSSGVADFLTAIVTVSPYIPAGAIVSGLVDAVTAGDITSTIGLEALIAIGAGSAPALQRAAEAGVADAIVQQKAIAANLSADIAYALGQGAATGAQAVTFLANVYLARLQTVVAQSLLQPSDTQATAALKATILAQLAIHSASGANLTAVAMAAKDNFANVNEIAAVSDLIVALSSMASDASFVTAQIAAAVPTISAYDAVSLLAGVAGQLGGSYLAATGVSISSLVASGAITAMDAGGSLHLAVVNGALSTAQANAIGVGAAAGGNPFVGAALIANIAQFNPTAASTAVRDAVVGNTLLTLQGLDVAAGFAKVGLANASALLVQALVTAGRTTVHAAIVEFGTLIGATATTITADQFVAILEGLANGTDLAGRTAIGADLAAVIGGGALTVQQAVAAFSAGVTNNVIDFGFALEVLIGASTGSLAGAIGKGFAPAIVSDGDTSTAMTSIKTAISAGRLTVTQATKLFAGFAGGGTQALKATVGLTAAELAHDGAGAPLSAFVSEVASGSLTAADAAFVLTIFYNRMASFELADTQSGASAQVIANDVANRAQAVQQISNLIGSGAIATAAALDQVEAAWTWQSTRIPPSTPDQIVALMLAIPAVNEFSGVASVAVGEKFASLVANGVINGSYMVSQAHTISATPAIDILAVMAQASATPGSLLNDIYAKLITLGTPTFVATTIGNLISPTGLTHAAGLSVLAQLAAHGNAAVKDAVRAEFTLLINAGTVTATEVNTALSDPQLPGTDALLLLIGAANTTNILAQDAYFSAIQTKIAGLLTSLGEVAGVQAIIAALDASNLSGGQIVDVLAKFLPVNGNTDSLIGNEIGKLELAGRISETDAATIVGRVLVTLSPNSQAAMARLLAFAGFFVGETAAQVAAGTGSAALPAAQVATILANLAAIDAASFNQPSLNAIYPYLGVAAGAIVVGLVSPQFTIAQALASITGATGIDANNRALVLFGVASIGSASQQIEAGKALATVYQSGGPFDLLANSGKLITLLTPDRATVLLAGMAVGGTAATRTYAGSLFAALLQTNGNQLSVAQVTTALDGSVTAQALLATDAASVLALIGAGLAANGANSDVIRGGLDTELNSLVSSGRLSVSAAVNALVTQAGAGSVALQAATGRLIASLQSAGLATSTTLVGLVDAAVGTSLTAAQAVAIYTGAAIVNTGSFAPVLGDKIGAMIEAGQIGVANAMAAIQAADAAYGVSAGAGEAALLLAAAGHVATGLQTAAGQAIGALLTRGAIAVAATITSIDAAIGASSGVSASQAEAILIGVAASSPFQAQVAIGVEFAALIAAGKLTPATVIQSVDQAMSSGLLSANPAFAVLVAMAATGSTLAASVASEVASLVSGARMTADEALAALFAAAGGQDFNFTSAQTDKAIAGIASSLVGQSLTNATQVAADLVAAQSVSHTISPNHALGVLVALAAGGPAAATQTYGAALPALLANGVTGAALTAAVAAPSISADNAVLFLASAVGAASPGQANSVEMASGAALAAILNASGLTAAQIVTDLQSAVASGALSANREAALIAALATGISLPGNAAVLGAELARLVTSNALIASLVFTDILSITVNGSVPASSIALIEAMSATSDVTLQKDVGDEIADLIQGGTVSAGAALAAFDAAGLTAAQNGLALLAIASGSPSDASVMVAVGQKLASLATSATETQLLGLFEAAINEQFLDGAHAVSILAAIATTGPSSNPATKYEAATAATNILTRLYADNMLQGAYGTAALIAGSAGVDAHKLVYWLASLAASPSVISDGASVALATMLGDSVLTDAAMVADIVAIATSAGATNSPVPTISRSTEVAALVGLVKNYGGAALVPLAATAIAAAIASGSVTAAATFNLVDAVALAPNQGSVVRAIGLLIGIANGLPAAQIADANVLVSSHIQSYITNGQISAADVLAAEFQAANGSTSIAIAVGGYIASNGSSSAITKISDAQTAGSLTAAAAAAAYFGVAGAANTGLAADIAVNQASITARLAQLQPNVNYFFTDSNGVDYSPDSQLNLLLVQKRGIQTTYAGILTTIDNKLATLVNSNAVTAAYVISTMQMADTMSRSQKFDLLFAMASSGSTATREAVGAAFVTFANTSTILNDAVWRGALTRAGVDFAQVYNGTMTVAAAIKDIEQYALAQHASVDAALGVLGSLFTLQELNERAKPSGSHSQMYAEMVNDSQAVTDELQLRYQSGASSAELALQVIRGIISRDAALGQFATFDQNFPSSFDGSMISAKANFLYDLRILQLGASNLGTLDPSYYLTVGNPGYTTWEGRLASKYHVNGYAYDQALLTDINYLPYLRSDALGTSIVNEALNRLGSRVFFGAAEIDLVNEVANGSMTPEQAIAALNAMLAPLIAGQDADNVTLARQLAFGWLANKAAGYIETNYVTFIANDGKKTVTSPFTPVTALFNLLNTSAYRNDVLGGLGAIASIANTTLVNAFDRASAFKVAQTILTNFASSDPAGLAAAATLSDKVTKLAIDVSTAGAFFESGFALMQGKQGLAGIIHDKVAAKPGDYQSYIDLGLQIIATGLPIPALGPVRLGVNGLFGPTVLGPAGFASRVMLMVLGMNAVSGALNDAGLGATSLGLASVLNVVVALSDTLNNTATGIVFAAKPAVNNAITSLIESYHAIETGDLSGIGDLAADLATSYWAVVTGGSLEHVRGVGTNAGHALADLFTGHPGDFENDVKALGADAIKILTENVYFSAAVPAIVNGATLIGQLIPESIIALAKAGKELGGHIVNEAKAVADFVGGLFSSPPPPPRIVRDVGAVANAGYHFPHSRSNYGDFYFGNAVDGYISGSTVFVDFNENGILDNGEFSTTTDANGAYALPLGLGGSIVITGGTDTSTHLPFNTTLTAPSGSTSVTALTTLVQKIAATNGGNVFAAEQRVAAAFGLPATTVVTQVDPIAAVRAGQADGSRLVFATTAALNTLILLEAAGATGDPTAVLAARIGNAPFGTIIDLTNQATIAELANASGVSAGPGAAVAQLVGASNTLLGNLVNTAPDPTSLLNRATAVTVVAQGETATALANAGDDPTLLGSVVNQYTGTNLVTTVQTELTGIELQPAEPYYGPPRWYLDPAVTGVVSTGSASGNSLTGSQSNQQMQTAFHDAAGSPSSVAFTPTIDLLASVTGLTAPVDSLLPVF
ncbi:hypothetical protein LJR220_001628 [Bradyrhizobium sp. LjRoot220]|uniref:beta strand repeat-containing protein n=1 Tax=Bradyrhizobium sp. LjRoot220 TaxID=3342284 RepID=UPI003ECC7676